MRSIQELAYPLGYKAESQRPLKLATGEGSDVHLRTELRAFEGMQKEAFVHYGPTGTTWRMVSDEGPYLKGTDLAPFPLAFFTAGVTFSLMTEIVRHLGSRGDQAERLEVISDHRYTMEGSALRGDMIGGAKPVEMEVRLETRDQSDPAEILGLAEASCPAQVYLRESLANTFTLTLNGAPVELVEPRQAASRCADPEPAFDERRPAPEEQYAAGIVQKLSGTDERHGVEGGVGSSLQATQKRMLHVRGEARLLEGQRKEAQVYLIKPIGSTFAFLADEAPAEGGKEQAPPALAFLTAGLGFCFMTQLGRYAHIVKHELTDYRVVQDTTFHRSAAEHPTADPAETHVFVDYDQSPDAARKLVYMGERTCFLHAALRGAHPSRIRTA